MSCESPKQILSSQGMLPRLLAAGLCGMSLLLLGCRSSEVAADELDGSEQSQPAEEVADGLETDSLEVDSLDLTAGLTPLAQVLPVTSQVELGGEIIDLEVTRTVAEQAKGLMFRQSLAGDRGMLFSFEPARPVQFWMKNVVIDLDMVFVHDDKIVGIAADVPPCTGDPCGTYGPGFDVLVDEVIELRGGRAAELGLAIGDEVLVKPLEVVETP